jgi:hypothetical protein
MLPEPVLLPVWPAELPVWPVVLSLWPVALPLVLLPVLLPLPVCAIIHALANMTMVKIWSKRFILLSLRIDFAELVRSAFASCGADFAQRPSACRQFNGDPFGTESTSLITVGSKASCTTGNNRGNT